MKKPKKKNLKIKNALSNPRTVPEWYQEGLGSWTNEAIFSRLEDYGLTLDESSFRQEAEEKTEPAELAAFWAERMNGDSGFREVFFQSAAMELWKRFLPDRDYWEWFFDDLEDYLEATAEIQDKKLTEEDISKILGFLDRLDRLLLKTSQEEDIPLEKIGASLPMRFDVDLLGWLLELPFDMARDGFVDQAVYVAKNFSFIDPVNFLGDLGFILAQAGRCPEALGQIEDNLTNLSNDPWVIIKAGDTCDLCGDLERAEKLYLRAIDMTDNQYTRDGAIERLIPLLNNPGHFFQ